VDFNNRGNRMVSLTFGHSNWTESRRYALDKVMGGSELRR